MVNRRWLRILGPSLGIVVAAGSIALVAAASSARTQAGWLAARPLLAGAVIGADDVRAVNVPIGSDAFMVAQGSLVGERTTHAIAVADLIRPDDVSAEVMVQVPVTLHIAPPLSPGETIDIYATAAGPAPGAGSGAGTGPAGTGPSTDVLVARGVTVVGAGSPVVIAVPAEQEPLWVALATSQTGLIAVLSTGVRVPAGGAGYQGAQAVQILAQLAQQGGDAVPGAASPAPSPTPAASPTAGTP